jgi:hypothetical protein
VLDAEAQGDAIDEVEVRDDQVGQQQVARASRWWLTQYSQWFARETTTAIISRCARLSPPGPNSSPM